nr:MAG TPA: hypothetical protein [Bacteriophage sp.]
MNRKEKKAVGLLKALNNLEKKCKIEKVPYKSEIKKIRISLLPEDYGIFEILLNLIEKLQKENEELKADNYELNNRINDLLDNIPVQEVKDKIEELKQEKKKYGNCLIEMYEDELVNRDIKILQELLEGRK